MAQRFAGFELDAQRAELRGPSGDVLKLRPKTLAMLSFFAANPGRLLSKQELMDAVWPNVHVGDDSLFQCIRDIRTTLGDDRRELIKLVSGRGYLFAAEVSVEPPAGDQTVSEAEAPATVPLAEATAAAEPVTPARRFGLHRRAAFGLIGLGAVLGLAVIAMLFGSSDGPGGRPTAIAVMPIAAADSDPEVVAMAANVTTRLADGLAKIDNIRIVAPQASNASRADFIATGELRKAADGWDMHARMIRSATGEVVWTAPVSIATADADVSLQQSRLVAGVGYPLALGINELINSDVHPTVPVGGSPPGSAKVVIEQATAAIMQTTRERFATAQSMLEKAIAEDADNVDLAVALSALQLRGVQMVWYSPEESASAQTSARSILQHALRVKPTSIPVLEAYCRFLNATNEFAESLVACARTLNFNPWDGPALTHIGLAQLQLGRFEDAVARFKEADRYDVPQVSRWTWKLDLGMTYLVMGRNADALPWIASSIAITPASGRSYMLLAAAYEGLGQRGEAKAAMEKALSLRPGSNLVNATLPTKNASPVFLAAIGGLKDALLAAGLPER